MKAETTRKLEEARQIIHRAIEMHEPKAVIALYSGGHDSVTATAVVAAAVPDRIQVAHIDTGIGIPETQQHVVETCETMGWPLSIYRAAENVKADGTPDPQIYRDIVIEHGFPGPAAHRFMYSKLKQRQIRRLVRDHKTVRSDRVMLIPGVRSDESSRRMGNVVDIERDGAQVWVAPMLHFTKSDQHDLMQSWQLPENPVKQKLCMSGECLCGAFADKGELDEIAYWYPDTAAHIREIQDAVFAAGHPQAWDDQKAKKAARNKKDRQRRADADMRLCVACDNKPH